MATSINWLTDLNNFMKNYYVPKIVMTEPPRDMGLYEILKGDMGMETFKGGYKHTWLLDTYQGYNAQAFWEDKDIPLGDRVQFQEAYIGLKEVIVNATLTKQAIDRATGGTTSWGNVVQLALEKQQINFKTFLSWLAAGDGSGRLATCATATKSGSGTFTYVFTCDNMYNDMGWDSTRLLKKNQYVDIYNGGTRMFSNVQITARTYSDRDTGGNGTGTFTVVTTQNVTVTDVDGWTVYIVDSKDALPMGITGIIQGANLFGNSVPTIWGLTRANYACLQPLIVKGSDIGGTDNQPNEWSLNDLAMALKEVEFGNGNNDFAATLPNVLLMNPTMAECIYNMMKVNIMFTAPEGSEGARSASGVQRATSFKAPDGTTVPIVTHSMIDPHMILGVSTQDLYWLDAGGFEFLGPRLGTGIWNKSYGDRKANFEAPYGGWFNVGGYRIDRCFVMTDLANDIS